MKYYITLIKGARYQLGDKIYKKDEKTEVSKATYSYFKKNKQFKCETKKAEEPPKDEQTGKQPPKDNKK